MHQKNSTTPIEAQPIMTVEMPVLDKPITYRELYLLRTQPSSGTEDALQVANSLAHCTQ